MYLMKLEWKEFSVDLEAVDAKMKADHPSNYKGNQAYSHVELVFESEPSVEDKEAIQAWWDGLASTDAEAASYRSQADIAAAMATMKAGIPAKTWDAMSVLERKMAVGGAITKAELIAASLL